MSSPREVTSEKRKLPRVPSALRMSLSGLRKFSSLYYNYIRQLFYEKGEKGFRILFSIVYSSYNTVFFSSYIHIYPCCVSVSIFSIGLVSILLSQPLPNS